MLHARSDYQRIQDPAGKIPDDEPVMLFRAQDKHMTRVLNFYLGLLREDEDAKLDIRQAVVQQLGRVADWQLVHGCKTPDL